MTEIYPNLVERAEPILRAAEGIDDSQRADLFDHYYDAKSSAELASRLNGIPVSEDLKQELIAAKRLSEPEPTVMDKTVSAINRLASIPQSVLDIAEKHPVVFKTMTDEITRKG
jgi:hypothetical protein